MSNVLTAVSILADILQGAARLAASAQVVSTLIQKAQTEGRDFTPEEWAQITGADDKAREELEEAIRGKA